jgi:hypothetical protein
MKNLSYLFLILTFVLVVACDDDSDDNNTNNVNNINNVNNTNNVNNINNTNNVNNINNTNNINNVNNIEPLVDACLNTADKAIADDVNVDQDDIAGTCTEDCAANSGGDTCITDCVETETGFSNECSSCYGDSGRCAIAFCILACIDTESAECATCVKDNCGDAFDSCTGLIPPE